ncbi:hypothetical protein A2881_03890 [Candidatus Peribacteria bacterium RIFCSPHIGHO2_01_FULL_55_13]|nr:MAG: hypothetical protein A2881_03890 [Candidatus Peribacteria bacterium RIFCSPHIGHO2_01_FULL_55_13]OGJ65569.1 MAG: hypothetical protein A3F36_02735 [Candidatus Peribacteria bacterium RIFCSPHIGHO2_12_FULL_55_11]
MRIFLLILIKVLVAVLLLVLAYGCFRTWKTSRRPEYKEFVSGTIPAAMPMGLYRGTAEELGEVSWKGKKFLDDGKGINLFERGGTAEENYEFTISEAKSLRGGHPVLRIDYNQPGNPLWLRFIVDEIVSVGDNQFLGAVYITVVPGFPFRMGYFRLTR